MATKKKARKKPTRRTAGKKAMPMKKLAKKKIPKKKLARKPAPKKAAVKTKAVGKKAMGGKTAGTLKKQVREKSQSVDTAPFPTERPGSPSGSQSGDLQGLSNIEGADSESVDELLEEGNAMEAGAVAGVEHAEDSDEKEVRTHESPEDEIPGEYGEYLDKE
jgi:hypothetical protein